MSLFVRLLEKSMFKHAMTSHKFMQAPKAWCNNARSLSCSNPASYGAAKRNLFMTNLKPWLKLTSIANLHTSYCCNNKPTKQFKKPVKDVPILSSFYEKRSQFEDKVENFFQRYTAKTFVDMAPEHIKPYLQLNRLDKPIGTLLLYFPCVYSICLATPSGELPSLYYLGLFGIGAMLMRGSGCIINDLWDRDLDKHVERTKDRPIASRKISGNDALKALAVQLTLSLGILLSLNSTCIMIGFASMILVVLYPLAKRFMSTPQAVLGLTFNIGAIMGFPAVTGYIDWTIVGPLYISCFFWTMYYDTIYGFQDVLDDPKAGIKSVPLLFMKDSADELKEKALPDRLEELKQQQHRIITFLSTAAIMHFVFIYVAGLPRFLDGPFILALIISGVKYAEQLYFLNVASRASCWAAFDMNRWFGVILSLGIITAIWLQPKRKKVQPENSAN
ncbi:unnamed protein product [Clavelina lepadiformis]|uniref:4-hydroxybenzoate polyprenyltransferase, mitochondrial n=1 Tax=Clavelina lepadiformis TaxID=159417 RepID=A0ABP0H0M7_CLALP